MFVAHCVAVAMTVSFTFVTFSPLSPFSHNPLADVRRAILEQNNSCGVRHKRRYEFMPKYVRRAYGVSQRNGS